MASPTNSALGTEGMLERRNRSRTAEDADRERHGARNARPDPAAPQLATASVLLNHGAQPGAAERPAAHLQIPTVAGATNAHAGAAVSEPGTEGANPFFGRLP